MWVGVAKTNTDALNKLLSPRCITDNPTYRTIERHPQGVFTAQYNVESAPEVLALRRVLAAPTGMSPPLLLHGESAWHGGELFDDASSARLYPDVASGAVSMTFTSTHVFNASTGVLLEAVSKGDVRPAAGRTGIRRHGLDRGTTTGAPWYQHEALAFASQGHVRVTLVDTMVSEVHSPSKRHGGTDPRRGDASTSDGPGFPRDRAPVMPASARNEPPRVQYDRHESATRTLAHRLSFTTVYVGRLRSCGLRCVTVNLSFACCHLAGW